MPVKSKAYYDALAKDFKEMGHQGISSQIKNYLALAASEPNHAEHYNALAASLNELKSQMEQEAAGLQPEQYVSSPEVRAAWA